MVADKDNIDATKTSTFGAKALANDAFDSIAHNSISGTLP